MIRFFILGRMFVSQRPISTQPTCCSLSRESRFLRKLINKSTPKKAFRVFRETDNLVPVKQLSNTLKSRGGDKRRLAVLNKLFMRNITDIMSTGSNSSEFLGHFIEITKVAVTVDYKYVNVYWIPKKIGTPLDVEQKLEDASFSLRHDLSQLKLMGEVPRINFIEDKKKTQLYQVEHLLSKLEPELTGVEKDTETDMKSLSQEIPQMSHDSNGLDYWRIMEKLKQAIRKAGAAHRETSANFQGNTQKSAQHPSALNNKLIVSNFIKSKK